MFNFKKIITSFFAVLKFKTAKSGKKNQAQKNQSPKSGFKLAVNKRACRTAIILLAILFIAFIVCFSGMIKPRCYNNDCFAKSFQDCSPVKYTKLKNNNVYDYTIYRSFGSQCSMKVSMKKTAPGTDIDIKNALEGKSMNCKIPKLLMSKKTIDDFENLIDYCTGPLKEGMYELMLGRMYGLVVSKMGDIVKEAQKVLKQF